MGRFISVPQRIKKQQVFTASGTFTPSAALIALGGVVEVRVVGGGGGGGGSITSPGGGGGSGADITRILSGVVTPQTVTIGAGGAIEAAGGDTSFGALLTAKGGKPGTTGTTAAVGQAGAAGGPGGHPGGAPTAQSLSFNTAVQYSKATGGGAGGAGEVAPAANSGGGGGSGQAGASGICVVTWEEPA